MCVGFKNVKEVQARITLAVNEADCGGEDALEESQVVGDATFGVEVGRCCSGGGGGREGEGYRSSGLYTIQSTGLQKTGLTHGVVWRKGSK